MINVFFWDKEACGIFLVSDGSPVICVNLSVETTVAFEAELLAHGKLLHSSYILELGGREQKGKTYVPAIASDTVYGRTY